MPARDSRKRDAALDRAGPKRGANAAQVEAMQVRLRELAFLHETSQVLAATLDLDGVLHSLMAQVREHFQVEAVSVALLDEETGELVFRVAVGEAAAEVAGMRLRPGQGIAGWVVRTGEPALVPAAHDDARFYSGVDDATGFHTQAMLAVPIRVEGRPIGVIEVLNPAAGALDEDSRRLLLSVADLASVAIHNAELYERVQQAERRYQSLFNESSDPVLVLDVEGNVLDANLRAVAVLQRPREQLVGSALGDLLGISDEAARLALQQIQQGARPTIECRIPSQQGASILEGHMATIDYGGHRAIQWLGHDVSEQVALERMREDLTHMVIHDLRNPLSSIMSSLQLIHAAYIDPDQSVPVLKLLRIARRSGQKLHRLIDSLLDLRRLETGEAELRPAPVDPAAMAHEAMEQIQPLGLDRRQWLEEQIAPDLPGVMADHDLILRVLTNLLDNAVKFTPEAGKITLAVESTGEGLLFTVSDTGPGIPAEQRQRVFDRFARLEGTEGLQGTGLGLTFCKLAVEAHGGRIWVEGEEGRGSQFRFTLPTGWEEAG